MAHSASNRQSHRSLDQSPKSGGEDISHSAGAWLKDSILGLPRRLIGSSPPSPNTRGEREGIAAYETELRIVGDSEWLVIEESFEMSSSVVTTEASQDGTPNSHRKKVQSSNSKPPAAMATPPVGPRANSVSGKNRPTPRPSSPHSSTGPMARKSSGRSSRSTNLEVQNGSLQRSVSPSRARNGSPTRVGGKSGSLRSAKKRGILTNGSDASMAGQTSLATKKSEGNGGGTSQENHVTTLSPTTTKRKVSDPESSASHMTSTASHVTTTASHGTGLSTKNSTGPANHPSPLVTKKKGILVTDSGNSAAGHVTKGLIGSQANHLSLNNPKRKGILVNDSTASHVTSNGTAKSSIGSQTNHLSLNTKRKGILVNDSTASHVTPTASHVTSTASNGIKSLIGSQANHLSLNNPKRKGILVNDSESSTANQPNHVTPRPTRKKGILVNDSDSLTGRAHSEPRSGNHSAPQPNGNLSSVPSPSSTQMSVGRGGGAQSSPMAEKDVEMTPSAFEKVRDTLRISRPKKKKGKGKKLAYSIIVDPGQMSTPEIAIHEPEKYQDPFETSFAESADLERKSDHKFKPAAIPHNKPEYCDHCGDMAWGLYRQVLKCSRCSFTTHRKCESKIMIGCSLRMEQAILQHDKQVEDMERIAAREEVEEKREKDKTETDSGEPPDLVTPAPQHPPSSEATPSISTQSPAPSSLNSQLLAEKMKLSRKIREYNRKTTPVHHIHIKSSHQAADPTNIEYHGFVRVHMHVQRPIHVSTAITRTSWYQLMRPVKERTLNDVDGYEIQTAFYLPLDTNRLVHIQNSTTTKELIQILLKKFCVTDNPKKFSLYEEYGSDCRRLFEEDRPLEISLDASVSHRNSKLVLRDNTYSTIQWDAFSHPELNNFIQILHREEELYGDKLKERFEVWRKCIQQSLKERCMEEQAKKTKKTVNSRLSTAKGKLSPKNPLKKSANKTSS